MAGACGPRYVIARRTHHPPGSMNTTMASTISAPVAVARVASSQRVQKASAFTGDASAFKAQRAKFSRPARSVQIAASASDSDASSSRRNVLIGTVAAAMAANTPFAAQAAGIPKGFNPVNDLQDNYQFLYPFGWQEVAVEGEVDVVFKDVIEPLESVSLSIIPTETTNLADLGTPDEVGQQLVERVLSTPSSRAKLLSAKVRETAGKTYYTIEFVSQTRSFTRHGLSTIAINDGKFYQLTTGSNERRWNKMKSKLSIVTDSFQLIV